MALTNAPRLAIGPAMPGVGSWEWIGTDMADALKGSYETEVFDDQVPECDVALVVKYLPRQELLETLVSKCRVIYMPVDFFGSAAEIDLHMPFLRRCARIIVHSPSLRKYFQSYCPVNQLDHHVKYLAPMGRQFVDDGPILWVGMRTNLEPLIAWLHHNEMPAPLHVLTNLEAGEDTSPQRFGFGKQDVTIEAWSPEQHKAACRLARAAIDIKGSEFRQRHKPAAKAIDFVASGLPLAMNEDSSSSRYLRTLGFDIPAATDTARWLSREYWQETRRFGKAISELFSRQRIAKRLSGIIDEVWAEAH